MSSTPDASSSPDDRLDLVFHALSDRTRRALLARLAEGEAIVTALAAPFDMSLPAVSKHLRVLERAGLVARTVEGRVHRCSFAAAPLAEIEEWLDRTRDFWEGRLAGLAAYVESGADRQAQSEDDR
jgi:DNA-binding transcriptional ArsR family regulator